METSGKIHFIPHMPLRALSLALAAILIGGVCWIGGTITAAGKKAEKNELSSIVLENSLAQISELATVNFMYTNMAQFENSNVFYGVTLPFTTKRFILTYDGVIKAGIDFSLAEVVVNGTSVTVTLPEAKILSHEIDEGSIKIFNEQTSIFNPFTVEDYSSFRQDQKAVMEQKATDRGLLTQAQEKAESSVEQFLSSALPESYTLTVRSSSK
ncbi:MAG: DUF4230 domain-containing protein [Intestinimonas sp.]|nr:DUF4230 domain-containing protein [Intestinimonas sp.]